MSEMAALLYESLNPHAGLITGSADRQSVEYIQSTWRSWLARAEVRQDIVDHIFSSIGPDAICRSHLRSLAHNANSPDGRLVLLIAALIWGRGKKNGRLRDQIVRALKHQGRDEVLEHTANLALIGKAAEAYRAWTLPGLRAAFFTKWLWAVSSLSTEKCCLVLDRNVWLSLGALGWDSRVAAGCRDRPSRYAAYVADVHECARRMNHAVTAEDIEYTLFWMRGDLSKLQSRDH